MIYLSLEDNISLMSQINNPLRINRLGHRANINLKNNQSIQKDKLITMRSNLLNLRVNKLTNLKKNLFLQKDLIQILMMSNLLEEGTRD